MTPTAKEQRQRSGTRVLHERQDDIVDLSGSPPPPKRLKLGNGEDDGISFSVGGTRKTSLNVATSGYFSKRVKNGWTPQLDQMSSKGDGINTFTDDHDHPDPSELPESSEKPATVIQSNLLESYRYARPPLPKLSQSDSAFGYHGAGTSGGMTALQSDTHPRDSLPIASQVRTIEQEKRHQEWQRRIMAPGGIVPRRRSLALDEAAAAEARLQAGEENHDDEENETPQIDDVAGDEEEENRRIADRVGTKLKEKYAAKGLEAVKGKAKGKGKKKEEEVGPSGQTYTPLEKQFMEIKADNADVLLMMEGVLLFCW